jgi:4-hydroxythreonine-4-phosphate dehydrogenase
MPGQPVPPVRMMLANTELRVVLVTIHMSLRRAIARVDLPAGARRSASPTRPRAGLGPTRRAWRWPALNPHAGEGGLFGDEEIRIIAPAIAAGARRGHRRQRPACARHRVHARPRHAASSTWSSR